MGILISLYCWAILAYSRVVGPPPDTTETRTYFAKIGIHVIHRPTSCLMDGSDCGHGLCPTSKGDLQ